MPLIDVHTHVTPQSLPEAPKGAPQDRWPCMRCVGETNRTLFVGEAPFRELDERSWDVDCRLEDMDRDGIALQVLSPMPELLSYWHDAREAALLCDASNQQIAEMIAREPKRFRGLGAATLQSPGEAARQLPRLKREFGLSGIQIGSNINGQMLGDASLDAFWAAAEENNLAVFVHALHPVAARAIDAPQYFAPVALFPVDVAMAVSSILMAGVLDRFPRLRLGFSHGGGALGAMLGRLDKGWALTEGFGGQSSSRPSIVARQLFYDSNVYDPLCLRFLCELFSPSQIFLGTDYPYDIMQQSPFDFVSGADLAPDAFSAISFRSAGAFLDEDFSKLAEAKLPGAVEKRILN